MSDQSDVIDLGVGHPSGSLLPASILERAAAERLASADEASLQYGTPPGLEAFRHSLATFLTRHYTTPVDPDHLFVTAGASHGLDLACSQLTRPGDTVLIEEPSYFYALGILERRGLKLVPVAMDEGGLRIDDLRAKAETHDPTLLYTIPTFHNPTARTLDAERRAQIDAIAAEHDFHVVADEVYQLLGYQQAPPPRMRTFDAADRVVSLGSFSKILAPGLRLGWIEAAAPAIEKLGACGVLNSGGGVSPFTQTIVQALIDRGWQDDHLETLKSTYQPRSEALYEVLRAGLPAEVHMTEPLGGFFIWLELPESINADQLLELARRRGVGFRAGARFSCTGSLRNCLRVGFSNYDIDRLREGATRLVGVIENALR